MLDKGHGCNCHPREHLHAKKFSLTQLDWKKSATSDRSLWHSKAICLIEWNRLLRDFKSDLRCQCCNSCRQTHFLYRATNENECRSCLLLSVWIKVIKECPCCCSNRLRGFDTVLLPLGKKVFHLRSTENTKNFFPLRSASLSSNNIQRSRKCG